MDKEKEAVVEEVLGNIFSVLFWLSLAAAVYWLVEFIRTSTLVHKAGIGELRTPLSFWVAGGVISGLSILVSAWGMGEFDAADVVMAVLRWLAVILTAALVFCGFLFPFVSAYNNMDEYRKAMKARHLYTGDPTL